MIFSCARANDRNFLDEGTYFSDEPENLNILVTVEPMDPANIRFTNFKTLVNSGASVNFLHKLTLKYQCSTIYPLRELVYQAPGGPKADRFG